MEHDVEDASYHSTPHPAAQHHRHRQHQTVLLRFFAILILTDYRSLDGFSRAYASRWSETTFHPLLQSRHPQLSLSIYQGELQIPISFMTNTLYLALAASGGMLLVALLCCFMLSRKEERRVMPPGPRPLSYSTRYRAPTRQPERSEPPPPSEAGSVNTGRFSGRSKIQRKSTIQPQPLFGIDPFPQPTPSEGNSYIQHKQPVPGVPQHPGLAMYSPEPLPYANSATQMRNVAPSAGANSQRSRRQQAPIPIPPPGPAKPPFHRLVVGSHCSLMDSLPQSRCPSSCTTAARCFTVRSSSAQSAFPPAQLPPAYYQQNQNQNSNQQQQVSALSYLSSEAANRPYAQSQSQSPAPFHLPPPEGASSFAVPLQTPFASCPTPTCNPQYQYQYQDQRQQQPADDAYSYRQEQGGPQQGAYQYAATKSSGRREQRGSSRSFDVLCMISFTSDAMYNMAPT
ncbi:hypothetical protein CPB84DRAFT_1786350 [Gymnopilus junonius]|uniref:Uncharacterized protein n=1 Tax=Gymnopilus junonius TaxID=109634 RepID=A0A9P5NK18_GYMJU|nr:hypothetical protein CPB84DRAFT_1786350 [Gymnopilus junonius]